MDAHSKWPEAWEMASTSSTKTIAVLNHLFSRYGFPDQVVSDNGPQFTSQEFSEFLRSCGVKHLRSAPYNPATNGLIERFNKTLKQAIKTSRCTGKLVQEAVSRFLFSYRSTPHSTTEMAPSELFLGRKLKARLDLLKPDVRQTVLAKQAIQKTLHDRKCKERAFCMDQSVVVRDYRSGQPRWSPGIISKVLGPSNML